VTGRAAGLVEELVARGAVPGASLVVADAAGVRQERHVGHADADGVVPVRATTRFPLASLTKPLVACAALVAVEEGILDLDAPLADVVPDVDGRLTLRACLSHAAGLPESASGTSLGIGATPTWPDYARAVSRVAPTVAPGSRRVYSNVGYALAGLALERAAGMPLDVYVGAAVLAPLGLHATSLGLPPAVAADAAWVREPGLWAAGVSLFNSDWFRGEPLPQSGGWATAVDYAAFLRVVLRGGVADDGTALLAEETCAELVTNQGGALEGGVLSFMTWPQADWGLGFELRDAKARHWTGTALSPQAATHFGASGTLCVVDPGPGLVIALFANRGTYGGWMLEPGGWPDIVAAVVADG
jgi:CubicO group peptidase (beta-lactamase class C family)